MPAATESIAPLLRLLGRARREARWWIVAEAIAELAVVAAAVFWGLLALDWLIEPPPWARGVATAGAAVALGWLLATRLIVRLAVPLSDRGLALALERRDPRCGDTLSTALTLADETGEPVNAALATRTVSAAADLAGEIRPGVLFRRRRLVGLLMTGLLAAGSVGWLAAARPAIAEIWMRRLVLLEEVSWPRRVQLEAIGFPGGVRKVARGDDVDVLVAVTAAGAMPDLVELRRHTGAGWETVRMGSRGGSDGGRQTFGHLLEAVGEDLKFEVRGGDARLRGLRLEVVEPPSIAAVAIQYTEPDYLGGGRREAVASRVVPVPAGSRVDLDLEAGKPLAAAEVRVRFASSTVADSSPADQPKGDILLTAVKAGDSPATRLKATIESLTADAAVTVTLQDTDGITARDPFTLLLAAVPDEPPRVALDLAGVSTAVTTRARLPFVGILSDDHGLAAADVSLTRGDDQLLVPITRVRPGETRLELPAGTPEVVSLADLAPSVGDQITAVVTARDGCTLATGPNLGRSETWTLEVVTPDALQAMLEAREVLLRRRFETAIEDLAQARSRLESNDRNLEATIEQLGSAAARSRGETVEIAAAFRGIRAEFATNDLVTPELEARLVTEIAVPLAAVAAGPLTALAEACRPDAADGLAAEGGPVIANRAAEASSRADSALAAMRAVLARMLELESFNEVVEKLRGIVETQEAIRRDTLKRQRQRARELLE